MIFALVVGCFAGVAAASGYVILDFNGGYYDGEDIQPGLTQGIDKIEDTRTANFVHLIIKEIGGSDYLVYRGINGEEIILNKTYLKSSSASEGYYRTFAGWFVSQDGSEGILFDDDGKIVLQNGSDIPQYAENSVEYDYTNVGTVGGSAFLTWNSTTLLTGNITLYAKWAEWSNENYVFLDANGGSFGGTPSESSDYGLWTATRIGYGFTITENTFIQFEGDPYVEPTRDGYTFKGWSATSDGKNIVSDGTFKPFDDDNSVYGDLMLTHAFSGNEQFKVEKVGSEYKWVALVDSSDIYYNSPNVNTLYVTLYAVWEKIEQPAGGSSAIILIGSKSSGGNGPHIEYKYVTFDTNGGLGEMAKQQFTGGQTKALSLNQFTFAGKNFAGWALEPTGMVTYTDGQEIMVDEDLTLYAAWVTPIPDAPDVPSGDDGEATIPTWLAVLIIVVVLAVLIALIVYFLVIRRGAA